MSRDVNGLTLRPMHGKIPQPRASTIHATSFFVEARAVISLSESCSPSDPLIRRTSDRIPSETTDVRPTCFESQIAKAVLATSNILAMEESSVQRFVEHYVVFINAGVVAVRRHSLQCGCKGLLRARTATEDDDTTPSCVRGWCLSCSRTVLES